MGPLATGEWPDGVTDLNASLVINPVQQGLRPAEMHYCVQNVSEAFQARGRRGSSRYVLQTLMDMGGKTVAVKMNSK